MTDASNQEQVIVCLRWVDAQFEPHEEFIGLHHVQDITTNTIVHVLKDTVLRMNLNMSMCRAQCYDGAANMKKAAQQIKAIESRTLYLHCYGHSLNLAVADTLKEVKPMSNTLDHCLEICKLLKFSPRREAIFSKLKSLMFLVCVVYAKHAGQCVQPNLKVYDKITLLCLLPEKKQKM